MIYKIKNQIKILTLFNSCKVCCDKKFEISLQHLIITILFWIKSRI